MANSKPEKQQKISCRSLGFFSSKKRPQTAVGNERIKKSKKQLTKKNLKQKQHICADIELLR